MTPRVRMRKLKAGGYVLTGSLVFDWQRKAVGTIERATGLPNTHAGRQKLKRIVGAAEKLLERGRVDILEAVKRGQVHPLQLLDADRLDKLNRLPTAEYLLRLDKAMQEWADGTENALTRKGRRAVVRWLLAENADATVGTLVDTLKAMRVTKAKAPTTWNRTQQQAMAFIRDTFGKAHPIHDALGNLGALKASPVRKRAHLSPDEFRAALGKLGPAAEAFRAMALTGMNPKEAWEDGFEVDPPAVRIHGKKARTRERVVPWLAEIQAPTVSRDVLIWHLNKIGLYPYCARHSYSRWLEDSGIPAWRVAAYLGHRAQSMTQHYQRGDLTPYLVGDARLLRVYLGMAEPPVRLEVSA